MYFLPYKLKTYSHNCDPVCCRILLNGRHNYLFVDFGSIFILYLLRDLHCIAYYFSHSVQYFVH